MYLDYEKNSFFNIGNVNVKDAIIDIALLLKCQKGWAFKKRGNVVQPLLSSHEKIPEAQHRGLVQELWLSVFDKENHVIQYVGAFSEADGSQHQTKVYMYVLEKELENKILALPDFLVIPDEGLATLDFRFPSNVDIKDILQERRIKYNYFSFDTRRSIGRISSLTNGDEVIAIKQGTADPIDITKTLINLYTENSDFVGPIQLDVNPTTACTDKCTFCFNVADRKAFPGVIKIEKLLDQIEAHIRHTNLMHIKISGFGDPFIYPDLWKLVGYCSSQSLYVTINTNGFGLGAHIEQVLEGVNAIRFSIDSFTPTKFELIHGTNDLHERMTSIKSLLQRRAQENAELIVGIHYVAVPENIDELLQLANWSKLVGADYFEVTIDKFDPTNLEGWKAHEIEQLTHEINGLSALIDDDFNIIFPPDFTLHESKLREFRGNRHNTHKCYHMQLRHYITPHGELGSCNSFNAFLPRKKVFSNINEDSPENAINLAAHHQFNKNSDCYSCVVPFGLLNDLCEWLKLSLSAGKEINVIRSLPSHLSEPC